MSSQHCLSQRHKCRQHHVPKQPSQGGERGDKMSRLPINLFISLVQSLSYRLMNMELGFNKRVKND